MKSSVHIPNTITSIGMKAFACCNNLVLVTFNENSCLEIVDPWAFSNCDKLIRLPGKT